jgi:hypothetical protein
LQNKLLPRSKDEKKIQNPQKLAVKKRVNENEKCHVQSA